MNACHVLREARKQVALNGNIQNCYFKDGCYCAVGYILKELGLTDEELLTLGNSQILSISNSGYYYRDNALHTKVYELIRDSEIGVGTLMDIQRTNDKGGDTRESVLTAIDEAVEANCQ